MELTRTPDVSVPAPRFVPEDFDPADAAAIEELVEQLMQRPIESGEQLREWIVDRSELASMVWGEWIRRGSAMHRNTADEALKRRHLEFQSEIVPLFQTLENRLDRRYLESPYRGDLGEEFAVYDRELAKDAEIFREENTRLGADEKALATKYQEIQGAAQVELDGRSMTLQQAAARMEERDRSRREEAYMAIWRRRLQDRDAIDELFDQLLDLRHRQARNAGFEDYIGFRFAEMHRFDYTPEDCTRFHAAVEKVAVPASLELLEVRRRVLGLDSLRPWDRAVNLFDREPERLFEDEKGLIDIARRFFTSIDESFAGDFEILVRNGLLDLMSRPGKAPGAYNAPIADIRLPFIFGNAVGLASDVRTLLHEGGHAFHTIACRDVDVIDYRRAPAEFAEVASMSMEMFGLERMETVYGGELARELAFEFLDTVATQFGSIALVDAFQHWIYTHPGHDRDERSAKWIELRDRFMPGYDTSGLEEFSAVSWQRIPHLFSHPLYYIDYGIALLGALQMWRNERRDHDQAVAAYRRGLALGGSRPLPKLFEEAGLRFAMDEEIFREVLPDVMERIGVLAP